MKRPFSIFFFAIVIAACTSPVTVTPSASPALATVAPSIVPTQNPASTATPRPSATLLKPSPTPFITAPAPAQPALVPILMYHHIKELAPTASELDLTWTVAPKNFQAQMEWLAQHSYHAITMAHLNAHLKERAPLPTKPIVITFDDGWVEGYTVAFSILKKNNFVGTYFAYTQPIDRSPSYLSWKQVGEMSGAGMDFQAHTLTHPDLRTLNPESAMREIADSKKALETRLNKPVVTLAFPNGAFNNAVVEMVKRAGFESAVTIDPGYRQRADRIYMLQRIRITYNDTLLDLQGKLPP